MKGSAPAQEALHDRRKMLPRDSRQLRVAGVGGVAEIGAEAGPIEQRTSRGKGGRLRPGSLRNRAN
jgi:hypothetical protein